ncbi:flagellar hook protein FlgE [Tranquillimonas alkanivorans]|uniref:Flagellar hook protein FlgE n=1 Tax=Tranquillimonas alkanivorans TaxID=441119 RepID=A0A1I5LJL6_9RHOB|nr:flagellar hook-basal body complex protein [Tranquillimonas alkanivorans]SFO97518.1 flagellar hook protein FlgE [Tranquillimonas alkanivorans]
MSISSSLQAGVSGLSANATRLAGISDNISNSSTNGYKRVLTDFHSMVLDTGSSQYSAGGVRTTTQRLISEGGQIVGTSNPTDIAVSGLGMLPVTSSAALENGEAPPPLSLMTTGAFRPDVNGFLTTASGMVLTGWPAEPDGSFPMPRRDTAAELEPVSVSHNQFASNPTTRIDMGVNLPASDTTAGASGDPQELSIEYFDNLSASQTLDIAFTPSVPAAGASNTWTMSIADSASGGAVVAEYTLAFDDAPGTGGTLASVTAVTGGAYDPATGTIPLAVNGQTISMQIGELGSASGLTQLNGDFAPTTLSKNGSPVGNLLGVEIDETGVVSATYDTGFVRPIYRVPLAVVANPDGLTAHDNQTYTLSNDSGTFYLWDAGDGPAGRTIGYAQEGSATDVARELTHLIQTQRAYSSNAKIIQTVALSLAFATDLPVEICSCVSAKRLLIDWRFWSAVIALVFVRMLDIEGSLSVSGALRRVRAARAAIPGLSDLNG